MNSVCVIFFCLVVASVNSAPSLIGLGTGLIGPADTGAILEGPSAKATIVGPDGSIITSIQNGGVLAAEGRSAGLVTSAIAPGLIAAPATRIITPIATPLIAGPGLRSIGPNGIPLALGLTTAVNPGLAISTLGLTPVLRSGSIISSGGIIAGSGLINAW